VIKNKDNQEITYKGGGGGGGGEALIKKMLKVFLASEKSGSHLNEKWKSPIGSIIRPRKGKRNMTLSIPEEEKISRSLISSSSKDLVQKIKKRKTIPK